MMPRINYDFEELEKIMKEIRTSDKVSNTVLNDLKRELNSFFKDSKCREILYTKNDDKLFFGMCVIPFITTDDTIKILQSDEPVRINQYYLELDSRIFSPLLGLTDRELVAVLLHEVGHIVNDSTPVEEVRHAVDSYMVQSNDTLTLTDSVHYLEILGFGIKDTIRKFCSMFEYDDEELLADEFAYACGYGNDLHSAFRKIIKKGYALNSNVKNKLIVLCWTLRLYKDVKLRRIPALKTLNKGKDLSGSTLEKRELDNVARRLNRIDDSALLESGVIDDIRNKYDKKIKSIKYKGIRSFEEDLYEYRMRVRNAEDEDDALFLLRAINTRMAIIDDYVSSEQLSESEQKRWFELYDSFSELRDTLSKKHIYRDRIGIIVNYPDIKPNRM